MAYPALQTALYIFLSFGLTPLVVLFIIYVYEARDTAHEEEQEEENIEDEKDNLKTSDSETEKIKIRQAGATKTDEN